MRILYLDLDTLRPDHLGCYGYHRNTSPNIDSIAAQGTRFNNYYCSDAPCLPSRTALMTSRFGIHSGVVNHGGTAADVRIDGPKRLFRDTLCSESMPAMLRKAGLKTVTISPFAERHGAWSFYAGFSEMHNTGKGGNESAEDVTPTALKWIEHNAAEDNWFLHLNYWDAHTPYRAPADFGNPFENEPLPEWITGELLVKHRAMVGPHTAREINMYDGNSNPYCPRQPGELNSMADVRRMVDGYDCGIRYMDDHIGRVLDAMRQQGVMDDLVVIISSDHAENMGELGIWGEHATADYITCRIPMIIRWPGMTSAHVDDGLHYNLDLAPTLSDMLGQKRKPSWDGQSYAPVIRSGENCGRDYLVVGQCAHGCQRGVRWDNWMYVRTYHDGYHLFDKEQLFDIAADPHEQDNLAMERPEMCREAVHRLSEWHDSMMATMESTIDPLWTSMQEAPFHARGRLVEYCKRLEETERGWAVEALKKRHPGEFR